MKSDKSKKSTFNWVKVMVGDVHQCWPWLGPINTWGYGDCLWEGKRVNASRAAYLESYGQIEPGLVVCHRCDNPICCNPGHLFKATQAENLADCRSKGRSRGQFMDGRLHPKHTAKLNDEKVEMARALYASGVSQVQLGKMFGVNPATMSRAIRGESWGVSK